MNINRRDFLKTSALAGALGASGFSASLSAMPKSGNGNVVVALFLRGAADGLSLVPPYADNNYYNLRPSTGVPAPGGGSDAALDLDGFFGLHPALSQLHQFYTNGELAIVHATGSPHDSHSHFEAQDIMELGMQDPLASAQGWANRYLELTASSDDSLFRGTAIGTGMQLAMQGNYAALGIETIENFDLLAKESHKETLRNLMKTTYAEDASLNTTAINALEAMDELLASDVAALQSQNGAEYDENSSLAVSLMNAARLIRADMGCEIITVDSHNWDHHDGLVASINERAMDLDAALASFVQDLGDLMDRVTIVVMTEFGRRAYENASGGTDHGHGGVMFALGAGVNGGQVITDWPGLETSQLYGKGDLDVTIDYRAVLGSIVESRLQPVDLQGVFPDYTGSTVSGLMI